MPSLSDRFSKLGGRGGHTGAGGRGGHTGAGGRGGHAGARGRGGHTSARGRGGHANAGGRGGHTSARGRGAHKPVSSGVRVPRISDFSGPGLGSAKHSPLQYLIYQWVLRLLKREDIVRQMDGRLIQECPHGEQCRYWNGGTWKGQTFLGGQCFGNADHIRKAHPKPTQLMDYLKNPDVRVFVTTLSNQR